MPGYEVCKGQLRWAEVRNIVNNMSLTMQLDRDPVPEAVARLDEDFKRLAECWPCFMAGEERCRGKSTTG